MLGFQVGSNVPIMKSGILLPKLFWPTGRKNCSSDCTEKLLKFEAEGQDFAKFLMSVKQFIQTVRLIFGT